MGGQRILRIYWLIAMRKVLNFCEAVWAWNFRVGTWNRVDVAVCTLQSHGEYCSCTCTCSVFEV